MSEENNMEQEQQAAPGYYETTPGQLRYKRSNTALIVAIIAGAVALLALGLIVVGAALRTSPPAPVVSSSVDEEIAEGTEDIVDGAADTALDMMWNGSSASERKNMCIAYNVMPEAAWNAFNEGADGAFTREQYDKFFSEKC